MDKFRTKLVNRSKYKSTAMARACSAVFLCVGAGQFGAAYAGDFGFDNGVSGLWTLDASLGTSWRAGSADRALVSTGNGGTTGGGVDDGTLNYNKGNVFSTIGVVRGEIKLKYKNFGAVIGGKAWYDQAANNKRVAHGSYATAYEPGARLDDSGFDSLSKFSGTSLGNAYAFGSFSLSNDVNLNVKLGNQVVNWGESVFISGVNQFGAYDVTAARKAGAQVKDILLPIPQLAASLSLGSNASVEAFYQFAWRKNVLDGCGTYWSASDAVNCPGSNVAVGSPNDLALYRASELLPGSGIFRSYRIDRAADAKPSDSGQFGLAGHFFAAALDTDFGVYYVSYHDRSPIYSTVKTPSSGDSLFSGDLHDLTAFLRQSNSAIPQAPYAQQFFWDYSAENIQVLAASASTVVGGWAIAGELSYAKGVPVQINFNDLGNGAAFSAGPLAYLGNLPAGGIARGYDLKNKQQLQISTNKIISQVAGAQSLLLIGEIGFQHWLGIGDPSNSVRYGRSANFGTDGTEGFFTSNAWGYRLRAELSYPGLIAGVNINPRIFWSQDVKGISADATFIEDRTVLGLGVRAEYNKNYYADFSYTKYNKDATYDVLHDRDYFSAAIGINF